MKKKKPSFTRLKALYSKYFPYLRNKYVFTLLLFIGWMLFFDNNDIVTRIRLKRQLAKLKTEKEFYKEEMKKIEETNQKLFSSDETLEKFAREEYLMKRDNEEVFLIVEEKD